MKDLMEVIDGKANTWFMCRIKDARDDIREIGSLRFEGEDFTYSELHSAFVEVYGSDKKTDAGIPKVNVTFGWPRLNGVKPALKLGYAYSPHKTGSASPDCAWVKADGENARVEVGPIFKRDEAQRQHELPLRR